MHAQMGQLIDNKIQKDQENLNVTSEELGAKAGYCTCPPAHNSTKGMGKPPKLLLQLNHWTHLYSHAI